MTTAGLCARCGCASRQRRRLLVTQVTIETEGWAVDRRGPLEHLAAKPRPGVFRELMVCEPCAERFCREHGIKSVEALPRVH